MDLLKSLKYPILWGMRATIDSRETQKGVTFFAIRGERVDGHDFLEAVAERGAEEAVIEDGYAGPDFGLKLTRVPDVKEELQRRARVWREQIKARVVGITGSVGKTTTKEFAATLLSSTFRVDKSARSHNSQLTLPLTILNSDPDAEVLILEMGMSRPGELLQLSRVAQPEIVIITRIDYSHSAFFENLEGIAKAKAEILQSPRLEKVILFEGLRAFEPFASIEATTYIKSDTHIGSPFEAAHLQENFLAAKALAGYLEVPFAEIEVQAKKLSPFSRRFERIEVDGITFINDTYNANPASTIAALQNLPEGARRIAVLGEMRELGKFSKMGHKKVGEVARQEVDLLFALGEETKVLAEVFGEGGKPVHHFMEKEALVEQLRQTAKEGDVILVKGSNSLQMWTVVEGFY